MRFSWVLLLLISATALAAPKAKKGAAFPLPMEPTEAGSAEGGFEDVANPKLIYETFQIFNGLMKKVNRNSLVDMCKDATTAAAAAAETAAPKKLKDCYQQYAPLLNRPTIRVDYVSGYQNFGSLAADPAERVALVAWLQRSCGKSNAVVCGFKRAKHDADLFTKEIPWIDGKTKKVEIRLTHSAATGFDDTNQGSPQQYLKTQEAKKRFAAALEHGDIVYYSGHARGGLGPDFSPFGPGHLLRQIWEEKSWKPGVKRMREGLAKRKNKMFLFGLLACDSKKYFEDTVTKSGKVGASIVSTGDAIDEDSYYALLESLENVLGLRCPYFTGNPQVNSFQLKKY